MELILGVLSLLSVTFYLYRLNPPLLITISYSYRSYSYQLLVCVRIQIIMLTAAQENIFMMCHLLNSNSDPSRAFCLRNSGGVVTASETSSPRLNNHQRFPPVTLIIQPDERLGNACPYIVPVAGLRAETHRVWSERPAPRSPGIVLQHNTEQTCWTPRADLFSVSGWVTPMDRKIVSARADDVGTESLHSPFIDLK